MRRAAPLLAIALLLSAPAAAGPVADAGVEAEKLLEAGDHAGAVAALDAAIARILAEGPLTIRKALFVEKATGFGAYVERAAAFRPDEPIVIYVEPAGFIYGANAGGGKEMSLVADFVLQDEKGETIFAKDELVSVAQPVRYENREVHFSLTLNLTGLAAGAYVGKFRVRDRHSDKSARFDLPFEIRS